MEDAAVDGAGPVSLPGGMVAEAEAEATTDVAAAPGGAAEEATDAAANMMLASDEFLMDA